MSVATHLAIDLDQYDARIRTFIPDYEEMLDVATSVLRDRRPRVVVDLGTGTGALAGRVVKAVRGVSIVGIDEDQGMLAVAARRLPRRRTTLRHDSFLRAAVPACDAVTASFALHHVASPRAKRQLFARARAAVRSGGLLVSADCHPSAIASLAAAGFHTWRTFLARTYGSREARAFLAAWAQEDFYTTLDAELRLLHSAGFVPDVVWRRQLFAVIVASASGARH
jgi:ubiquinone/menaquinone biosynthesis C-methylase UbiE